MLALYAFYLFVPSHASNVQQILLYLFIPFD